MIRVLCHDTVSLEARPPGSPRPPPLSARWLWAAWTSECAIEFMRRAGRRTNLEGKAAAQHLDSCVFGEGGSDRGWEWDWGGREGGWKEGTRREE